MTTKMDLIIYTRQPPIQSRQLPSPAKRPMLSQIPTPLCHASTSPQLLSSSTTATTGSSSPSLVSSLQAIPAPLTTQPETYSSITVPSLKPPQVAAAASSTTPTTTTRIQPHAKDDRPQQDDDAYSMSFKVWRSQHMTNTSSDDHDNTPVEPPLPSTLREKYLRKNLRAVQLEHYRAWSTKEFRQRRQLQRQRQPDDGGDNDDGADRRLRVRFTLPTKFK